MTDEPIDPPADRRKPVGIPVRWYFTFPLRDRLRRDAYVVVEAPSSSAACDIVDTAYGYRAWAFFYDWARFEPQINQYRLREIRLGE